MIVLDTPAALSCLTGVDSDPRLRKRVATNGSLHAPHLIDAEILSALRGLVLGNKLTNDRATDALRDFVDLRLVRYPILGLMDRIWSLRHRMTTDDGCFVALAQTLDCPLVTCDARLARTTGHEANIELFTSPSS